jgi:hypothetical protein
MSSKNVYLSVNLEQIISSIRNKRLKFDKRETNTMVKTQNLFLLNHISDIQHNTSSPLLNKSHSEHLIQVKQLLKNIK